jgi:hypothetical protein
MDAPPPLKGETKVIDLIIFLLAPGWLLKDKYTAEELDKMGVKLK